MTPSRPKITHALQLSALENLVAQGLRLPRIFLCSDDFFDYLLPKETIASRGSKRIVSPLTDTGIIEKGVPADDPHFYLFDLKKPQELVGWRMWMYYGMRHEIGAYFAVRSDPYRRAAFEHMTKMQSLEIGMEYLVAIQSMRVDRR